MKESLEELHMLASWKTLDVPDDHDGDDAHDIDGNSNSRACCYHDAMQSRNRRDGSGLSLASDNDDVVEHDFTALAYDARMLVTTVVADTTAQQQQQQQHTAGNYHQHALAALATSDHSDVDDHRDARHTTTTQPQRRKRKNVSKQLQLQSLERYAHFTATYARLPNKRECATLLAQSHRAFVAAGGARDEPQLTPGEFLKLIRNRRRELAVRAAAAQTRPNESASAPTSLASGKRSRQQAQTKIFALVERIDATMRTQQQQAGRRSNELQQSTRRSSSNSSDTARGTELTPVEVTPDVPHANAHSIASVTLPPANTTTPITTTSAADTSDLALLQQIAAIHHETLAVQREIHVRLTNIQRHRHLQVPLRLDPLEPSSASV